MSGTGHEHALRGRAAECAALDELLITTRSGRCQVLVLRGEAGIGKTALLDYLAGSATGVRTLQVAGVQSDMELAFAGLQQLCAPLLGHLDALPAPQRDALDVAFGRAVGAAPDRFLVGLAVLSLLAAAADERPILCLVDDAQWLDEVSVQTLGFIARRLLAEPVALVFAVRDHPALLADLPELAIRGLPDGDARELLESVMVGGIDPRVRDRIVAETRGVPLAILEARAASRRPSSPAASGSPVSDRRRRRSSRVSYPASRLCRTPPAVCSSSPPPTPSATPRCSCAPPAGWASRSTSWPPPRPTGWSTSVRGCASTTR